MSTYPKDTRKPRTRISVLNSWRCSYLTKKIRETCVILNPKKMSIQKCTREARNYFLVLKADKYHIGS